MREEISALMDGELASDNARRTMDALKGDPQLHEAWSSYHLIGDVLRRETGLLSDFSGKVMERLESEPTVIAPIALASPVPKPARVALPLAAAVAGVGVVAWVALALNQQPPSVQVVATPAQAVQPAAMQAQSQPPLIQASIPLPSSAIKEYLIAHQGYSPSSSIQGMAPYMRTVTEVRPAADR